MDREAWEDVWKEAPSPLFVSIRVLAKGKPWDPPEKTRRIPNTVFEQVRAEPLLDPETAAPKGRLLGRVHKHTDDCDEKPEEGVHVHVLWAVEEEAPYLGPGAMISELRFSCVRREPWERGRRPLTQETAHARLSRELEGARGRLSGLWGIRQELYENALARREGDTTELDADRDFSYLEWYSEEGITADSPPEAVDPLIEAAGEEISRRQDDLGAFDERWHEAFERLSALKQIYVGI